MSIPTTIREYRTKADDYHNLKLHEAPFSKPRPSEVTIRIHAVSLQYRDLLISKGMYSGYIRALTSALSHVLTPASLTHSQKTDLVPGSDGAGEIVAFGEDVKGWKVGDRVCPSFALDYLHGDVTVEIMQTGLGGNIDGVLREYINVPAHSLVRIPPHLTYEEASTLPCAALTAYNALMGPVPLKGGDHVLVLGTGGVSIFGAQIALASGAIVIATSSSDEKLQVAKKLGVQYVINYKKTPNWEAEVLKITGGRGVDHVIEVGGPNTILKCAQAVRYVGNVHVIGFLSGVGYLGKSGKAVERTGANDHLPPTLFIENLPDEGSRLGTNTHATSFRSAAVAKRRRGLDGSRTFKPVVQARCRCKPESWIGLMAMGRMGWRR